MCEAGLRVKIQILGGGVPVDFSNMELGKCNFGVKNEMQDITVGTHLEIFHPLKTPTFMFASRIKPEKSSFFSLFSFLSWFLYLLRV